MNFKNIFFSHSTKGSSDASIKSEPESDGAFATSYLSSIMRAAPIKSTTSVIKTNLNNQNYDDKYVHILNQET